MIPVKDNVPTDRFPLVTVALIAANVVVYLLTLRHGGSLLSGPAVHETTKYGAIPHALTHAGGAHPIPAWETVLTSMFIHASIVQLAVNMLFLWIFGNTIEALLGPLRFLLFYLVGGVVALAIETAISPNSLAPTVGSAGAVAAVVGGYFVLCPRAQVLCFAVIPVFFGVVEVPARVMVGVFVAVQIVFAAAGLIHPVGGSRGVAYFASIGGLALGLLAVRLLAGRSPTRAVA
jgi:membrane associated rhomboid family serine protease